MKRLLDVGGGVTEIYHKDAHDNKFHIQKVQDVTPYLAQNAVERSNQTSGWKADMHKVASIPLVLVEQWWKELGSNPLDKKNRGWLIAKLNSSEFQALRTKDGVI